jgi:hypothetical protein
MKLSFLSQKHISSFQHPVHWVVPEFLCHSDYSATKPCLVVKNIPHKGTKARFYRVQKNTALDFKSGAIIIFFV